MLRCLDGFTEAVQTWSPGVEYVPVARQEGQGASSFKAVGSFPGNIQTDSYTLPTL